MVEMKDQSWESPTRKIKFIPRKNLSPGALKNSTPPDLSTDENDEGQMNQAEVPASPRDRIHQRRQRVSRVGMDGTISFVEIDLAEEDDDDEPSPPQSPAPKPKSKAVSAKPPSKQKKKEKKRKKQEKYRQDPKVRSMDDTGHDSLGRVSRSAIANLYGSNSNSTKKSKKSSSKKAPKKSSRTASQNVASVRSRAMWNDDDEDNDEICKEEDKEFQRKVLQKKSSNDELLRMAASALEAYQRSASRSASDDDSGIDADPSPLNNTTYSLPLTGDSSSESESESDEESSDLKSSGQSTVPASNVIPHASPPRSPVAPKSPISTISSQPSDYIIESIRRNVSKMEEKPHRVAVDADGDYMSPTQVYKSRDKVKGLPDLVVYKDGDDAMSMDLTLDLESQQPPSKSDLVPMEPQRKASASSKRTGQTTGVTLDASMNDIIKEATIKLEQKGMLSQIILGVVAILLLGGIAGAVGWYLSK
eukprot:Nitzschia sp. Nitz4//scaffold81_size91200//63571//64998//NITZ4_004994-RA/size91200-processed-gene-0.130-mRNA-1//-1//CDS//3329558734//650//frame0